MRVLPFLLVGCGCVVGQVANTSASNLPTLMKFVAPPYPRAAAEARILGKATTVITVDRDGVVTNAKTVVAHRVFESEVLKALKQWRFTPSDQEHTFQVTCVFELEPQQCKGSDIRPLSPETRITAELPTLVVITRDLPCQIDN